MEASSFPIERFRPNVLVSGGLAWEEDGWSKVRIGDNPWVVTSRCFRCVGRALNLADASRCLVSHCRVEMCADRPAAEHRSRDSDA